MNIQCDRCKKIYDINGHKDTYKNNDGKIVYIVSRINFDGVYNLRDDMTDKYLCPKCTYKLREWIKNKSNTIC
jgi:hypothetical protein